MNERDTEQMEEDEQDAAVAPAPEARGASALRRLIVPAALALGVVAVAAGAYYAGRMSSADAPAVEAKSAPAPARAKGEAGRVKAEKGKAGVAKTAKAEKRAPLYLAFEPAFVVNFQDEQSLRFLQVEVQVMAYRQDELDALTASGPMVRDALLMLFSDQAFETLATREGKERLRVQALEELRRIVLDRTGKGGLEAVYFTSFVMQ